MLQLGWRAGEGAGREGERQSSSRWIPAPLEVRETVLGSLELLPLARPSEQDCTSGGDRERRRSPSLEAVLHLSRGGEEV